MSSVGVIWYRLHDLFPEHHIGFLCFGDLRLFSPMEERFGDPMDAGLCRPYIATSSLSIYAKSVTLYRKQRDEQIRTELPRYQFCRTVGAYVTILSFSTFDVDSRDSLRSHQEFI